MDFVSLFAGICNLILAIQQQVEIAKANQPRAGRLAQRLQSIYSAIQGLEKRDNRDRYNPALITLQITLQQAEQVISAYCGDKTWFKRFSAADKYNAKFDGLNKDLADAVSTLQLGIEVEEVFKREQDEYDRKTDMELLRAQQATIQQLNEVEISLLYEVKHDIHKQNDVLQMRNEEMKDLLAKQLASFRECFAATVQGVQKSSPIDERYLVPLHTLKFMRIIGKGQFATVWLGQQEGTQEKVAIKLIDNVLDPDTHAQFVREVQIMSELRNKQIVQFYGASVDANRAAIVMEYLESGSLRSALNSHSFTPLQQKQLLLDMASGLQYLHARNILHRDLTSHNVLLDGEGRAKLIDFGYSKANNAHIQTAKGRSLAIEWLAPEYLSGDIYTKACDIYSFGMIAWEILTQQRPFATVPAKELAKRKRSGATEEIPARLMPFYRDFIQQCWSQDPNLRPNLTDFITRLQNLDVEVRADSPTPADEHYELGMEYEAKRDFSAARERYEKAAKKKHVKAHTNLGFFQLMGHGGDKNINKACDSFLFAANNGHPRAMMNLGKIFKDGLNGPKNIREAHKWYKKAASLGEKEAVVKVQQLENEMNSIKLRA